MNLGRAASVDLDELPAADATLEYFVQAVLRAQRDGRVRSDAGPLDLAIQSWAIGHGLVSLVANGPLPGDALDHCVPLLTGMLVTAGDDPGRCPTSVEAGWEGRR